MNSKSSVVGCVAVFGTGDAGELGDAALLQQTVNNRKKPAIIKSLEDKNIVSIYAGGQHSLALSKEGRVYSWGNNDNGALGRDSVAESDTEVFLGNESWLPCLVSILNESSGMEETIVQMVCGDSFSAVLTSSGLVYAWGTFREPGGMIGLDRTVAKQREQWTRTPKRYDIPTRITLIGGGINHFFAYGDGKLYTIGANEEGQLGRRVSSRLQSNLQLTWQKALNVVKITGGSFHTLYINDKGHLFACGSNNAGQLGLGYSSENKQFGFERVNQCIIDGNLCDLPPIIDISCGETHSIIVSKDGHIFSFGGNRDSQLGFPPSKPYYGDERDMNINNETLFFQPYPMLVSVRESEVFIKCSAHARWSLAITSSHSLYTWGVGSEYQLGNAADEDRDSDDDNFDEQKPYKVNFKKSDVIDASCGGTFCLVLLTKSGQQLSRNASEQSLTIPESSFAQRNATNVPYSMTTSVPGTPFDRKTQKTINVVSDDLFNTPLANEKKGVHTAYCLLNNIRSSSPSKELEGLMERTEIGADSGAKRFKEMLQSPEKPKYSPQIRAEPWSPRKSPRKRSPEKQGKGKPRLKTKRSLRKPQIN